MRFDYNIGDALYFTTIIFPPPFVCLFFLSCSVPVILTFVCFAPLQVAPGYVPLPLPLEDTYTSNITGPR